MNRTGDANDPLSLLGQMQQHGAANPGWRIGERLSGTTDGAVYLVVGDRGPEAVLKIDAPENLRLVIAFLNRYRGDLLPGIRYADPDCRFYLCDYISGTTGSGRGPKADWLAVLVRKLLNRYEPFPDVSVWGDPAAPAPTWLSFLEQELGETREAVRDVLTEDDYALAREAARYAGDVTGGQAPYALHGDCGVHNFLFQNGTMTGVIDPYPLAGPPLYDLLYAFCSSPDDLTPDCLNRAVSLLRHDGTVGEEAASAQLYASVLVQLYKRIGTCLCHHPADLPAYLAAWDTWTKLYTASNSN